MTELQMSQPLREGAERRSLSRGWLEGVMPAPVRSFNAFLNFEREPLLEYRRKDRSKLKPVASTSVETSNVWIWEIYVEEEGGRPTREGAGVVGSFERREINASLRSCGCVGRRWKGLVRECRRADSHHVQASRQ